ncbi:MAG: hypothetical protein AAF845_10265 [Bacteroidota bacterium]
MKIVSVIAGRLMPSLALASLLLAMAGCDSIESDIASVEQANSMRVNGEVQFHLDRFIDEYDESVFIIPYPAVNDTLITCNTIGRSPNPPGSAYPGKYTIKLYNDGRDTDPEFDSNCSGTIAYGLDYLIYIGGTDESIEFSIPLLMGGSGDFAAILNGRDWSLANVNGSADPELHEGDLSFDFDSGFYTTAEYEQGWSPVFTVNGSNRYDLPIPRKVSASIQYRNASGTLTTINPLNDVSTNTVDGVWTAQGGSTGTTTVTDDVTNDASSTSFTIPGGGGGSKCFPGGINWPQCDV